MANGTAPQTLLLGFLTVFNEGSGYAGGFLVTNSWGRPLEFRLSTAVQPNKIQQILYAGTLNEYIHADLIGKTLIDKTSTPVQLLFTDTFAVLGIRSRLDVPVLGVIPRHDPDLLLSPTGEYSTLTHPRSSTSLTYANKFAEDLATVHDCLDRTDAGFDLAEPFLRIREAMAEARRMGVSRGSSQAA